MSKHRRIKMLITFAAVVMAAVILSGCGRSAGTSKVSLALIGGGHSNMPVFSADCKALYGSMYEAAYTHGDVTMLNCDGSPQVFFQATIPESDVKGLSENRKKRTAEEYVEQLQEAYGGAVPSAPEVNTLKAITMAARALTDSSGNKSLVIIDSGLQTTGYINFTNGLLDAEPSAVIEALSGMQAIPDLTGVNVIWIGLGASIAPQEELSERQKANLKAIWEGVLYAAGAESVVFDGGYSTNTAYEGAPAVTTVPVETESVYVKTTKPAKSTPIETIVLDSTRLQFRGDLAVFVDEDQAERVLSDVAEELISHPNNHVYVIGTTAGSGGNTDYTMKLSQDRADVVVASLIKMGVPADQMTAKGLGSTDPYHEWDLDSNGNMIEEIAKRNRKTIIMDVNSPEAGLLPF